jgi:hypothetical protein
VVGLIPEALNVGVDIKPGDSPKTINLKSKGVLPVRDSEHRHVRCDDGASGDGPSRRRKRAAQRERATGILVRGRQRRRRLDIVLQFETQSLEITSTDTQANLTGRTKDGLRIVGHDDIRIVPN